MCKVGGPRCPSSTDPALKAARNARRREQRHAQKALIEQKNNSAPLVVGNTTPLVSIDPDDLNKVTPESERWDVADAHKEFNYRITGDKITAHVYSLWVDDDYNEIQHMDPGADYEDEVEIKKGTALYDFISTRISKHGGGHAIFKFDDDLQKQLITISDDDEDDY